MLFRAVLLASLASTGLALPYGIAKSQSEYDPLTNY